MVHGISAISRIDSKGRVSIPVGLRYKLKLLEGNTVSFELRANKLVLIPVDGQSGVRSMEVCGASSSGSNLDSDPKKRKGE